MLSPFPVAVKVFLQDIGEKEYSQYSKHYKQLNQDYQPYLPSPCRHGKKTIPVKSENIIKGILQQPHIIKFYGQAWFRV